MIDTMKPRAFQWFDLPFYDDENDFQFDDPEANDFVVGNNLLEIGADNFL